MKKVTLKELVADKIIFAVLVALYYWMWARNDWKDFYPTIRQHLSAGLQGRPDWDWLCLCHRSARAYHRGHRLLPDGDADPD